MAGGVAVRFDAEGRSERRDEVLHRTRAIAEDGTSCSLLIVNLSPGGMMARCERVFAADERVKVELPGLGLVVAEVRWSLGGRVGCRFETGVFGDTYDGLLGVMSQGSVR